MVLALVLFFGISLLTMYAVGLVEMTPSGGAEPAMNAQVIAVQQAYQAAGEALETNPQPTGTTLSESFYEANYPSAYDGHSGAATVIADGEALTVYSTDPAIPGSLEVLGFGAHCSSLAGLSVEIGGNMRLSSACEDDTDGELPASVPEGRLVIRGAF